MEELWAQMLEGASEIRSRKKKIKEKKKTSNIFAYVGHCDASGDLHDCPHLYLIYTHTYISRKKIYIYINKYINIYFSLF